MKKKIFTTFILCCLALFVSSQIINVPADQPSIQAGINVAVNGDTVLVAQGTYFENINYKGKAITVASHWIIDSDSANINNTIIDGSQPSDPDSASVVMFFSGEDTTSVLCGFTITNGSGVYHSSLSSRSGGGIAAIGSGAKIINNIIINNSLEYTNNAGGGGLAFVGGNPFLWTVIRHNIIKYNSVYDLVNAYGGGIYVSLNSIISNNIIDFNTCESATGYAEGAGIEFQDIFSNEFVIYLRDNKIRNNTATGISAKGGGVILFSGFYPKRNNTNLYPQNEKFSLQYSRDLINAQSVNSTRTGVSYIVGNTISHNNIVAEEYWWGSGIYLFEPSTEFVIQSNEISYNEGSDNDYTFGGAIIILNTEDVGVLIDGNKIKANNAKIGGGLYINKSYNLKITNNLFLENIGAIGGAIRFFHYLGDGSNDEFNMSYPINNRENASIRESENHPVVANNTFIGNTATGSGGAILVQYDPNWPAIFNSIFWENNSPLGPDIALADTIGEVPVFYNNINTQLISGNWMGEGNINADPKFIDPGSGNYCIDSCDSPCAGSGIDTLYIDEVVFYLAPDHDILGRNRPIPNFTQPDMGAYEVDMCVGIEESKFLISNFNFQVYPNPSQGISDIRYQIKPAPTKEGDIRFVVLEVYDIHGQKIRKLVQKEQEPGDYVVRFDGSGLPAGIYLVRLQAGGKVETAKVLLIK